MCSGVLHVAHEQIPTHCHTHFPLCASVCVGLATVPQLPQATAICVPPFTRAHTHTHSQCPPSPPSTAATAAIYLIYGGGECDTHTHVCIIYHVCGKVWKEARVCVWRAVSRGCGASPLTASVRLVRARDSFLKTLMKEVRVHPCADPAVHAHAE